MLILTHTLTLWIASDRVMCVHTLPGGKALASTNACNQSGSERSGEEEEKLAERSRLERDSLKKKCEMLMSVIFQQHIMLLVLRFLR